MSNNCVYRWNKKKPKGKGESNEHQIELFELYPLFINKLDDSQSLE